MELIDNATKQIQAIPIPAKQRELYGAGENIKSKEADTIWKILESTSNQINNLVIVDKVILQEYWQIDDPKYLNNILNESTIASIEQMWDAAQKFDMFFLMRAKSLNYHTFTEQQLPLENLISKLADKWDTYMQSQINIIQNEKITPKKTSVLWPFKDFPNFIIHFLARKQDYDQEFIDEIFEKFVTALETWIVDVIAPKAEKKKRERLIVVNIHYLIVKLEDRESIKKCENIVAIIDQAKEFMTEHIKLMLKDLVRKAWKNAYKFFDQIKDWKEKCGLTPEVVTFQPTHTDEKFQELLDELNKTVKVNCDSCVETLRNKIKDTALREQILETLTPFLEEKWNEWDALSRECYERSLTPDVSVVRATLDQGAQKDAAKRKDDEKKKKKEEEKKKKEEERKKRHEEKKKKKEEAKQKK